MAQRVGRRRHRLEADGVEVVRREDLRVRIALLEHDLEPAIAACEDERPVAGREQVVERPVERADGLTLAGRDAALVEQQVLGHRRGDLPFGSRQARQPQVGMVPEADRDAALEGRDRGLEREPVRRQRRRHLDAVIERKRRQPADGLSRDQPRGALLMDSPVSYGRADAVDREPVVVAPHVVDDDHGLVPEPVGEAAQPVRPRMQQRDPHRRAGALVLLQPLALRQQLLAAVAQRGADHPVGRLEGCLQRAGPQLHQWTPRIRYASAVASPDARSSPPFSPFAALDSGNTL